MGKLGLRHHLHSIIPLLGGLKSELAGVSDQVIGCLERMHGVALAGLIAQAQLQLVLPLHLLLVVVIGLHGEAAQHRIVALATLVPVARHIVLQELEVVIATDGPEIRTGDDEVHRSGIRLYRLGSHLVHDVRMILLGLGLGCDRRPHLLEMRLRIPDQVGAVEVNMHQGSIER